MEKSVLLPFFLIAVGVILASTKSWAAESAPTHNLLPVPNELGWREGSLKINAAFNVSVTGVKEDRVQNGVKRFIERLEKRTGLSFANPSAKPSLVVDCNSKGLPVQTVREDEFYALTVSPEGARLTAPNPLGILRGLETLLQLAELDGNTWKMPSVSIQDKPRFPWRGLLIDVCRHWQPVEVIKRNLDGLAEAKMNVLHWHLSENQAFRVESKKFPKLTGMGSEGKFYTQDEVREIVAYARERGIRIIPEFDVPGHSTAWLVGYPELAAGPGPYEVDKKFGVFSPAMDPTRETVYQFLDTFIGEMAELFPDEYFHIGGDEVDGRQWNENPAIQAFMYDHDMKSNEDLQAYFNTRLLKLVTKHEKRMVGWDEIFRPDLPKSIVVHSWRGAESLAEAAKLGFDGILSNGYYLDNIRSAAFHYGMDPVPAKSDLTPQQKSHVLGGESCMWSEYVSSETIDSRIWPRHLAVAERLWSPASTQDVNDFYRRMEVESLHLDELGLTHNSNYLPMLKRIIGNQPVESFKVFADVMEPLKLYERYHQRHYTFELPLDNLVDVVRPESLTARSFRLGVEETLKKAPAFGKAESLRASLQTWAANHKKLEPILKKANLYSVANQSQDLSAISQFGLEALDYLKSGKSAPASWQEKAAKALERAQHFQAEVEIAVISPIRALTLAAGQLDKLKTLKAEEWNQSIQTQVKAAKRNSWE
jgi:hexosaminidase